MTVLFLWKSQQFPCHKKARIDQSVTYHYNKRLNRDREKTVSEDKISLMLGEKPRHTAGRLRFPALYPYRGSANQHKIT